MGFWDNALREISGRGQLLEWNCPKCGINKFFKCPNCGNDGFKITGDPITTETIACTK